ncbi:hypothetical protein U8607_21785 [Methylobacterium durans]|jgi:hypothetical protein|uniref:DUF2188 domain-containing protein n=1 Tax=Methylobacterium durans TaxID=2202825 RepID=A0A2U8WD25_9HYPH|nr:hypothetical protein [Methylobacterium durans]AWN43488.1 hypothetical protein DK389_27000 [Methylobacterium durans]MEA1834730.1 hypothetical protein [Methylobacterium durans]
MTEDVPHPYSIEVSPLAKPEGHFGWAIRRNGKLTERSDRPYLTERKAWEAAAAAVERDLKPGADARRR